MWYVPIIHLWENSAANADTYELILEYADTYDSGIDCDTRRAGRHLQCSITTVLIRVNARYAHAVLRLYSKWPLGEKDERPRPRA